MGAFVPPPSTASTDDEAVVVARHQEQSSSNNRPAPSSCLRRRNPPPATTMTTNTTTHRQVESLSYNAGKTPRSTMYTVQDVQRAMENQEAAQSSNGLLLLILDNRVVNLTTFADKHPGGRQVLQVLANGCDATDAFLAYHPPQLMQRLSWYTIGQLMPSEDTDTDADADTDKNSINDITKKNQSTITYTSDVDNDADGQDGDGEKQEETEVKGEEIQEQIRTLQQDMSKRTRRANMSADFQDLHETFLKEGLYETSPWYYLQVVFWLAALLAASIALTMIGTTPWIRVAGGLLQGIFLQQVAFVGHDLGHNAVTHSRYLDGYLGLMFGPLVSGISLEWWKSSHNLHHVAPNSVDYDLNIQHAPIMAIDSVMAKWFCQKKKITTIWAQSLVRFLLSHQDVTFFPFVFLLSRYNLYLRSFFFLLTSKNTNMQNRIGDLLALVLFHVWTWSLVRALPHWTEQVAFMVVSHAMANVINIQIVLSHFPMPIYRGCPIQPLPSSSQHEKEKYPTSRFPHDHHSHSHHHHHDDAMNACWAQVQVATALNVDCPSYMDWFHGGLQFQIEHHLWPRLPRHNLRAVQARTQAYCRQYNLPYHSAPFLPAVASVYQTMVQVAHDFRTYSSEHATALPINKNKTPSFMDSLVMKAMTMEG